LTDNTLLAALRAQLPALPSFYLDDSGHIGPLLQQPLSVSTASHSCLFWHAGADLTNAVVDRVDFRNANLSNVKFINAVITGTTFDGANLAGAIFEDALIGGEDAKRL
jgi:hypothetical protein